MVKTWIVTTFILLYFLPLLTLGNEIDTTYYKSRASDLIRKGADLSREGRDVEALDSLKIALEIRKMIYGSEHYMLRSPYSVSGVAYKNLGQHDLALEYLKLAEESFFLRPSSNNRPLGIIYVSIGNVYRSKLDYANALNYFERGLEIFNSDLKQNRFDISSVNYSIAELYFQMGDYTKTIEISNESYEIGDEYDQIGFNGLLASSYSNLGDFAIAQKYHDKLLRLSESLYEKKGIDLAIIYMDYSEFLITTGKFKESHERLQKAYDIIKLTQPWHGEQLSRYYELEGGIFLDIPIETQEIEKFKRKKRQNLNQAIGLLLKSLDALGSSDKGIDISNIRLENCISFMDCLEILKQIGDAYCELALLDKEDKNSAYSNALQDALDYYQAASQLTQQARREISNDESKIQLAELEHSTFTKTVETAYLAYQASSDESFLQLAFHNAEQLKSSSVFDKLSDDLAQENSLIPDSLLDLERTLNSTISIFNQKLYEENSKEPLDTNLIADLVQKIEFESNKPFPDSLLIFDLEDSIYYEELYSRDSSLIMEYEQKLFNTNREREELNRFFEEQYADYYELKYSNNMLSLNDIQARLKKNEVIFEYVLVEPNPEDIRLNKRDTSSTLYIFSISKNKVSFHSYAMETSTMESLGYMFGFMSNPTYMFTNNDEAMEFCLASNNLYNILIAPYLSEIGNKTLLFIPDGKLNYISFDGLIKSLPDTSRNIDFSKLDYLIRDYNIGYANSANILFKNRTRKQKIKNRTLSFAPIYESQEVELANASYTLLPLPGVQQEVDAIAKTISTEIFRGEEATEVNFRENCQDYDILHLAMHAYINDSLPAFSRLAFAPQEQNPEISLQEDGWLNTTDIYNLELNARLAVLSACNTGVGRLQKGEGMMSLARGFLYAGCPSIVMSLWEVEDESGTKIMSSFYKNLRKGKSKSEALRQAKLSYLNHSNSRLAHPHYWMSFKSIGDDSPIYTSYDIYFFGLLILLILAFSIDQTIRIRKMNRRKR